VQSRARSSEADSAPLRKRDGRQRMARANGRRKHSIVCRNPSRRRVVGTAVRHLHRLIAFLLESPLTVSWRFIPRTIALVGMLASLGCPTGVQPGLANVPVLSTSPVADANVHDVVANGRDSCERGQGPGPQRYQIPECADERLATPPGVVSVAPPSATVMPWLEHYYSRWPCALSEDQASRMTLTNPASPHAASDRGLILTCAGPL
jgi:hypothetical protein